MVDAVRHLRGLLGAKVEFEARYPAAFEVLFPRVEAIRGLTLPQFDVRILKNAPALSVVPAGWNQDWRVAQDSGDAFSGPVATPSWVWATNSGQQYRSRRIWIILASTRYSQGGKEDPEFRTKLKMAEDLVRRLVHRGVSFRAVVADSFYGEDREFKHSLGELEVGYVLALKKSHSWWHLEGTIGALWQAAQAAGWKGAQEPGDWTKVMRAFRDGHQEEWWALEVEAGPYGKARAKRALVVSSDPEELPDLPTWYLTTNLLAPTSEQATEERETEGALAPASVAGVVRLFGVRMWVEQSYKQVKHALGWSDLALPGKERPRDSSPLAVGVLGVLVLLVGIWALADR